MVTCMGGWCRVRENCARYEPKGGAIPIERLCEAGMTDAFEKRVVVWIQPQRKAA
jgi:hypothetical protein